MNGSSKFGAAFKSSWLVLAFMLILISGASLTVHAQGCPTLYSPNRGWAQNTVVRYTFDVGFTTEQQRQIRAAAAEWTRANSANNSRVSFVEDPTGTSAILRFQIASLPAGNPADFQANYSGATLTITTATVRYDPNNVFPGTGTLVSDPSQPGYSTIVMKLVLHEMGHLMGLDHPTAQVPGGSVMNFAAGINDQGNNIPTTVTACDQATINSESIYPTITAPVLQLSAPSYTANEAPDTQGRSFATITVTRTGDTSGASSVRYATSDSTDVNFRCNPSTAGQPMGVASRKCDYHIAVGRLRFAAGETSKQIIVSIVNDVYIEGPETFTISLGSPTGGTLGAITSATVTINDNDTNPAQPNPIDNTRFYVRMLYVDLLSREPDDAGWNGWTSRIDLCGQPGQAPPPCDRVTVGGDGFMNGGEFFDRQFFVIRLYRTALGRIPGYNEVGDLAFVSGFLSSTDLELNKQELVADIMARPEFANKYNGLSNAQFVDTLLQTAGVTVPQSVRDTWVRNLDAGQARAQVYREVSERQEVINKYLHEAQVVSAYYGFFTRNPDGAYLNYLQRLDAGQINQSDLANAFINAQEYRQRFGPN